MTQEHREKIQSESIHAVENLFSGRPTYPESYCELYEKGAAFGYNLAVAPVPTDPDDEKAAEKHATEYITEPTGYGASFMKAGYKDGFLAGCAHKVGEVERLRKQLEESLLLYNNMTHNITTLNAENERLKADNAKYGDMASALSKAGQEIERLRQALNQ